MEQQDGDGSVSKARRAEEDWDLDVPVGVPTWTLESQLMRLSQPVVMMDCNLYDTYLR